MHENPGVVIIGGAITSVNSWDKFTANCIPFLTKNKITIFGTANFFASHGDFAGWDQTRKKIFLKKFMGIVNMPKKIVIAHGVKLSDFEMVKAEFPKFRITPYKYCLEKCLAVISEWARSKAHVEPVAVFIEAGQKTESQTVRLFRASTADAWLQNKYRLASITVMPKILPTGEIIYPFQVADIVANSLYKHHRTVTAASTDTVMVTNTLLPLLKPKERYGYFDTPELIRKWFRIAVKNKEYLDEVGEKI